MTAAAPHFRKEDQIRCKDAERVAGLIFRNFKQKGTALAAGPRRLLQRRTQERARFSGVCVWNIWSKKKKKTALREWIRRGNRSSLRVCLHVQILPVSKNKKKKKQSEWPRELLSTSALLTLGRKVLQHTNAVVSVWLHQKCKVSCVKGRMELPPTPPLTSWWFKHGQTR